MASKARCLIVGAGGVGTMAAYALEIGGKAEVTAVMRSNYEAVKKNGISIDSVEYGYGIQGFRPTHIRNTVPNVAEEKLEPFKFILVTTKNIPDILPTVADLIEPAVTPGKTAIVLSQNGINIEKGVVDRFPRNPVISSVSTIGATERSHGDIFHDDNDCQKIGPFHVPGVDPKVAVAAAREYIDVYNGSGKLDLIYEPDVNFTRWRKLVYNASFNTVSTVLQTDVIRLRMTQHAIDDLIRPIMLEIIAAAKANGVDLPTDLPDKVIVGDSVDTFFRPSMCQDRDKGNYIEAEVIAGEPLRMGLAKGVPMPTLKTMYGLLKVIQKRTMEARGAWEPKFTEGNPYKGN